MVICYEIILYLFYESLLKGWKGPKLCNTGTSFLVKNLKVFRDVDDSTLVGLPVELKYFRREPRLPSGLLGRSHRIDTDPWTPPLNP